MAPETRESNVVAWGARAAIAGVLISGLLSIGVAPADASSIDVGSPLVISPTLFALPIDISDGHNVVAWQFDLSYDPTDVLVNASCDPFGGDIFCSSITGPVTKGDFFAAGAPFNLLVPGFVDLDPVTLAQIGHLFGVNGLFGGPSPYPSGAGIVAYVEFTLLGNGTSPITVTGSATSAADVPEPGTGLLFVTGLALARWRRQCVVHLAGLTRSVSHHSTKGDTSMRSALSSILVAVAFGLVPAVAQAQTTSVGPYYATPSWDQTLACATTASCPRFVVLSNFANAAVLDRETGLVWERSPGDTNNDGIVTNRDALNWVDGRLHCADKSIGGRKGWRLPSVIELASLVDPSVPSSALTLPLGHPFMNVQSDDYRSATAVARNSSVWGVRFDLGIVTADTETSPKFVWCVRGGMNADQYLRRGHLREVVISSECPAHGLTRSLATALFWVS